MEDIAARLDRFRAHCSDEGFLANRGLSNEVGIYIFAYRPCEEMAVRRFMESLSGAAPRAGAAGRFLVFDLYEILLDICRERRVLERIADMEAQRGSAFVRERIARIAPPEAYVERMQRQPHGPGDVVLIGGVGRVYPYMRAHTLLNNLQHAFADIPTVLFYPGEYSGQSLTLFGRFMDDNYYRAFNLI